MLNRSGARLILLASLFAAVPASAQESVADLDTSVRCAATFAIIAGGQERGDPEALRYPRFEERGREFFVQVGARLIDERGLNNDQVMEAFRVQAEAVMDEALSSPDSDAAMRRIMQPCLALLEATVPSQTPAANP